MTSCQSFDRKADGAGLVEDFAARMPAHIHIAILAADRARLGDAGAELAGVIEQAPQRGADRHGGDLAAGVLIGPRHAGEAAIFLGETRIEHAAEIDVAGRAAGGDDDRLAGADIEALALVVDGDAGTRPELRPSRWIAVMRCSSRISTPALSAAACSGRIRPAPARNSGSLGSAACRCAPSASRRHRSAWCAAPRRRSRGRCCSASCR